MYRIHNPPQKPFFHTNKLLFITSFFISLISFFLYFYILSATQKISFKQLLQEFSFSLYQPNFNVIITTPIGDISPMLRIYSLFGYIILILFAYFLFCKLTKRVFSLASLKICISTTAFSILIIMSFFQQIGRTNKIIDKIILHSSVPPQEQYKLVSVVLNNFIESVKEKINKDYRGIFVTDLKKDDSVNLIIRALTKYKFYPNIVFYNDTHETSNFDCILIYYKNNPLNAIPKGFHIVEKTKGLNFILAIKDK